LLLGVSVIRHHRGQIARDTEDEASLPKKSPPAVRFHDPVDANKL
jgi:hypothetical protein